MTEHDHDEVVRRANALEDTLKPLHEFFDSLSKPEQANFNRTVTIYDLVQLERLYQVAKRSQHSEATCRFMRFAISARTVGEIFGLFPTSPEVTEENTSSE